MPSAFTMSNEADMADKLKENKLPSFPDSLKEEKTHIPSCSLSNSLQENKATFLQLKVEVSKLNFLVRAAAREHHKLRKAMGISGESEFDRDMQALLTLKSALSASMNSKQSYHRSSMSPERRNNRSPSPSAFQRDTGVPHYSSSKKRPMTHHDSKKVGRSSSPPNTSIRSSRNHNGREDREVWHISSAQTRGFVEVEENREREYLHGPHSPPRRFRRMPYRGRDHRHSPPVDRHFSIDKFHETRREPEWRRRGEPLHNEQMNRSRRRELSSGRYLREERRSVEHLDAPTSRRPVRRRPEGRTTDVHTHTRQTSPLRGSNRRRLSEIHSSVHDERNLEKRQKNRATPLSINRSRSLSQISCVSIPQVEDQDGINESQCQHPLNSSP